MHLNDTFLRRQLVFFDCWVLQIMEDAKLMEFREFLLYLKEKNFIGSFFFYISFGIDILILITLLLFKLMF